MSDGERASEPPVEWLLLWAVGVLESASLVSDPRTTSVKLALPVAGTFFEAAVPASVIAARACPWLAAAKSVVAAEAAEPSVGFPVRSS